MSCSRVNNNMKPLALYDTDLVLFTCTVTPAP